MHAVTDIVPERYREPRRIGRGGMGEIYRAEDTVLGRTVAIKILAERYADDEAVRRRFTREALAAARLSSAPNTVTIFDVGERDGRPFIVMEFLPGGSLEDAARRDGAQPPGRALEWLEQAGAALDAAHAAGVVHRDVKPANLLLDSSGEVHVADFGIASAAGLDSMTRPGTVLGTAGYLAPEQARGERAGPASDRYAFAVVAFELLTGRRPYEHENPTVEATAHVRAPIPAATSVRRDLPQQVDDVFRCALAKDPDDRYDSCGELVLALRRAFDDDVGHTGTRTAVAPAPAAAPRPARTVVPGPAAPPQRRRSRALVPLALLTLLAAGVAGAVAATLLSGGGEEEAPQAAPETITTVVQETLPGTTVNEIVTVQAPAAAAPPPEEEQPPQEEQPAPTPEGTDAATGAQLNDRGFARMQAGDYTGALPLLEEAHSKLAGSGELAEAYTLYNLAYTRLQLGRCDGVTEMLDRSQAIQGHRTEIDRARAQARERC